MPEYAATMYKKILIANNGSEGAFKALIEGLRLAQNIWVRSTYDLRRRGHRWNQHDTDGEKKTLDRKFSELVAKSEAEAKHKGVEFISHMVLGRPAPAIADFLRSQGGFDLLIIGIRGHSALYHRMLGKTADRLLELAPCTVLVVK
jgi:nucleotide-binding universal stress UspA family protein